MADDWLHFKENDNVFTRNKTKPNVTNVKHKTTATNTFHMANYHMREFIGIINIIAGRKKNPMVWYV